MPLGQTRSDRNTAKSLPDKTVRALEEIASLVRGAQEDYMPIALRRAGKYHDPALNLALARLGNILARIERTAADARLGKYADSPAPDLHLVEEE